MSNFNTHLETTTTATSSSYPTMSSSTISSSTDSNDNVVNTTSDKGFYYSNNNGNNNHSQHEKIIHDLPPASSSSSFSSYTQDVLAYSGIIDTDTTPSYPPFSINSSSSINENTILGNKISNIPAPDEDAIKLFVGQVPRTMNENDLLPIMEEYGEVHDIIIIRDKVTGIHRGCAFVTYLTKAAAETAIEKMHNQLVLPPSTNPLQVRPAEGQVGIVPVQEHKLFIGMIPRNADDQKIHEVFEKYGTIEEVYILRHPVTGQSKGCAFLKFNEKQAALKAIAEVNGKLVMENGTSPLVVKFADSRKQRILRAKQHAAETRVIQMQAQQGQVNPYYPMQMSSPYQNPYYGTPGVGGVTPSGGLPNTYMYYNPYAYNPPSPVISAEPTAAIPPASLPPVIGISSPYSSSTGDIVHPPTSTSSIPPPTSVPGLGVPSSLSAKQSRSSSQLEGPMGANLFIYHLPHDITDADLATAFAPYGMVLSAKVYMDKNTGESKGFGFVSYNSPEEASLAIERMNGFQIGSKRLKVQHKRIHMMNEEEDDAYYLHHINTAGAVSSNGSEQGDEKQSQTHSPLNKEEEHGASSGNFNSKKNMKDFHQDYFDFATNSMSSLNLS